MTKISDEFDYGLHVKYKLQIDVKNTSILPKENG